MEATGGFVDDLALFLHERTIPVSIVNQLRIKAFGQSEMVGTKTDKVDAGAGTSASRPRGRIRNGGCFAGTADRQPG